MRRPIYGIDECQRGFFLKGRDLQITFHLCRRRDGAEWIARVGMLSRKAGGGNITPMLMWAGMYTGIFACEERGEGSVPNGGLGPGRGRGSLVAAAHL